MTKNTLKQLIRECIKESLKENKMDVIARKAARKNPDKNMGENKMDVIARKSARKNPDKNMGENKMDSQPAYVSRGDTRQSRRDQRAIAKLFAELETSKFMKDPVLFMAAETSQAAVGNIEVNRSMGHGTVEAVPFLRKDDDGLYYHIEIDLGFKDSSNKQKGFLHVYGDPNSDGLRVTDDFDRAGGDYITEDEVLLLIKNKISNELDNS